ncbi:MAG: 4Fe-4S ferredoxin, partial [Deltaproteobacteria bacterium]|nr:4Fe-4S ferredoxin [Deltaproteobacteria bacterium]
TAAEYALGAIKGKKTIFINSLTFITKSCDCFKTISKPIIPDIGILVSTDPVAIDRASLDLIRKHAGHDILKEKTGMDGTHQIEYAEKLGLGTQEYQLL